MVLSDLGRTLLLATTLIFSEIFKILQDLIAKIPGSLVLCILHEHHLKLFSFSLSLGIMSA